MNPLRADTLLDTRNPDHLDWLRENKPAEVQELTVYEPCPQADAAVLCAIPVVHRLTLCRTPDDGDNPSYGSWVSFLGQMPRTWRLQELTVDDIAVPESVRVAGGVAHLRFLGRFLDVFDYEAMIATGGLTHVTLCHCTCPDLEALSGLQQLTLDDVCAPTLPESVEMLHLKDVDEDDGDPLAFARGMCQELFLDHVFGATGGTLFLEDVHLLRLRVHGPVTLRAPNMHSLMHLETTMDDFDADIMFPNLQSLKLVQLAPMADACWFPDIRHPSLQLVSVQYLGGGPRMRLLLDLDNAAPTLLLVHVHVLALFGGAVTILGNDAEVDGAATVRTDYTVDEFPLLQHHL